MAGGNHIPIETRLAIIKRWNETRGWYPKVTANDICREFGVHKDTVKTSLNNMHGILARAKTDIGVDTINHNLLAQQIKTAETVANKSGHLSGHQKPFIPDNLRGFTIGVLPDCQVKPDISLDYLEWAGKYFADKKPDVIVNIGDFADMPSLSFHDVAGSMGYEGQRYKADILAVHQGMKRLMTPIQDEMRRTGWNPRLVLTLGNHENRIDRTIKATPKLDGVMGLPDLEYERWGWEVVPFLQPIVINGVAFCHYFCSGVMGRPVTSAQAMLTKKHMSCVAGHQQVRDVKHGYRGDGKEITAIIAGSYYLHDEEYLNHQTNNHFRGLYMLYGVDDGVIETAVAVNINHLRRVYAR
jgi:hypothetical protein